MSNIAEMLRKTAQSYSNKEGLVYFDIRMTWGDVYNRVNLVYQQLLAAGVQRGDVVGIYAPHSPTQVVGLFAASMADAIFTIISPVLKENQINHQICDSSMKFVIGTGAFLKSISLLCQSRQICMIELTPDGVPADFSNRNIPTANILKKNSVSIPKDVSNYIYTSGSTGRPKGVVIPHRTLLDGARIVSQYLNITSNDSTLSILPFNFDYGLNQLMTAVYTGARIVIHNFTFPQDLINVITKENITGMAAVPSVWPHLFNPRLVDQKAKPDFRSLRYITTAGGTHRQDLLKQLAAFFPNTEIIIMYGLTESFRSTYLPFSEIFKRLGSIGKAVPEVEILVLDKDLKRCRLGEKGELIHRGAFVSYGYLNNPDKTKEKFIEINKNNDGCIPEIAVRSGDIVSLDEDGFIYFHGRADMQIKSNGYRISPSEVEEAALSFRGLSHAAVFGRPDLNIGESVNLAYSTYHGEAVDTNKIIQHISNILPSYAVPQCVKFYDKLPLTTTGKVDYVALCSEVWTS